MGEPAGIGGEITLKAWLRRTGAAIPFVAIDDADRLRRLAASLGLNVPVHVVDAIEEVPAVFARALPVLDRPLAEPAIPGRLNPANAPAVIAAIEAAVGFAKAGAVGAVVTNPIHKKALYEAGFAFPGHTEFLAALCEDATPVMMLAGPTLRVVPVTIHVSLRTAIATLNTELIVQDGDDHRRRAPAGFRDRATPAGHRRSQPARGRSRANWGPRRPN